jgi:hypothetical protein
MAEAESDQGFHVRDRRRGGAESEPEAAPPIVQGPALRPPAEPPEPVGAGHAPEPPEGDERSLVGLFAMLASLAAAALEGIPDPATGHARRDPGQAAEIIDLLLLLREKTEGRRTLEESQALDEILYELQLGYVRATTRR